MVTMAEKIAAANAKAASAPPPVAAAPRKPRAAPVQTQADTTTDDTDVSQFAGETVTSAAPGVVPPILPTAAGVSVEDLRKREQARMAAGHQASTGHPVETPPVGNVSPIITQLQEENAELRRRIREIEGHVRHGQEGVVRNIATGVQTVTHGLTGLIPANVEDVNAMTGPALTEPPAA